MRSYDNTFQLGLEVFYRNDAQMRNKEQISAKKITGRKVEAVPCPGENRIHRRVRAKYDLFKRFRACLLGQRERWCERA